MKLDVHFEAMYDKWEFNPGNLQNEVVVLRSCLRVESKDTLEELFQQEADKLFAHDSMAVAGYHHRIRITGMKVDGAPFNAEPKVDISVKLTQSA